jgi:hypothetical protein
MQRQKVKGTGHKQPADVQTEPNFYSMSPSKASQPPTPLQSAEQQASPPSTLETVTAKKGPKARTSYDEMSPGLTGLHGAAQLLKGLASGAKSRSLEMPFSLGQSAAQAADAATTSSSLSNMSSTRPSDSTMQSSTQGVSSSIPAITTDVFAPPYQSGTLSLLGRVTNIDTNRSQESATPSAFFWPPRQKTTSSTLIHPSPRLHVSRGGDTCTNEEPGLTAHAAASTIKVVSATDFPSTDTKTNDRTSLDEKLNQRLNVHPPLIPESTPVRKDDGTSSAPVSVTENHDEEDESKMDASSRDTGLEGKTYEKSKLSIAGHKVTKGIETEEV